MLAACKRLLLLLLGVPVFQIGQPSHRSSFDWDHPKFHELVPHSKTRKLKSTLLRAIEAQLRPHMADLEIADEKELRSIAQQSRFELLDLNGDGAPEVIVQPIGLKAGCGATGNCPFWIFAGNGTKLRLIMDTIGQMYRVEWSSSKGYTDLAVASHDSATQKTIFIFRYQGARYRQIGCYQAWWSTAEGKILRQPLVHSCSTVGKKPN